MAYDAESNPGLVSFTVRFSEETVLVGYPKAYLWVEAKGADDMDLFVLVQKTPAGITRHIFNSPCCLARTAAKWTPPESSAPANAAGPELWRANKTGKRSTRSMATSRCGSSKT